MKRIILLVACVAFSVAMAGCGRNTTAEIPKDTNQKADPNAKMDKAPSPPPLKMGPGDPGK